MEEAWQRSTLSIIGGCLVWVCVLLWEGSARQRSVAQAQGLFLWVASFNGLAASWWAVSLDWWVSLLGLRISGLAL